MKAVSWKVSWFNCGIAFIALLIAGCTEDDTPLHSVQSLPSQTHVPQLLADAEGLPALLYVQSMDSTPTLQWARWQDGEWQDHRSIASDPAMLINWADRPQMVFGSNGAAYAHWLTVDPRGDFAYGIAAVRSTDGGRTWSAPARPHQDTAIAEHGFAQWLPYRDGAQLVWLDGRDFDGHPDPSQARMELRMNNWPAQEKWEKEAVLDSSVCTCCPMTAAQTSTGTYELIYRDRTADEIRDFSRMNIDAAGGSYEASGPLHDDGWQIAACPVNGASLAANDERVLAVWYTAAGDQPQVLSAWRNHDESGFGNPRALHTNTPLGRISTASDEAGQLYAVWLQTNETGGVDWVGMRWNAAGEPFTEEPEVLVAASERRAGGFPALVGLRKGAMLGWTNPNPEPHVMTGLWK